MKKLIPYVFMLAMVFVASCKKDDFDEPSGDGQDPALVANTTIAQLKSGYVMGDFDSIDTEVIISGIVTADDRSGNFYKTVVIQDATGAIAIRVDVSDYYTRYPIGRRIFVKCKGLWLGDYNELIQLGGYVDNTDPSEPSVEPIPYALVGRYIFPGKYNLTVAPLTVTIDQLIADPLFYQNMLIRLNDVQFIAPDTNKTYADIPFQASANRTIENCDGDELIVRSSYFATFADVNVPNGKGPMVSIFSVFGSDAQLLLRDLYDVDLSGLRCGQVNPTIPTLTTASVSAITGTSATSGGNITGIGTSPVITYGICWNTTGNPTTANSKTTNAGPFTGAFADNITGLTPGTQYYVRAYATNASGTGYGTEKVFTAVAGGGGINETFSSQSSGTDISLAGWSNLSVVGNRFWRAGIFSGDTYAQATAFGSGLPAMESWLITPEFDLTTIDTLTFRSSWGFFVHNGLSVWISTDYDGVNFATATWTQLSATLAVQADGQYTWVPSGDVALTSFSGTAYIGFKYVGDGTTNTTTWRIDDVIVH